MKIFEDVRRQAEHDDRLLRELSDALRFGKDMPSARREMADVVDRMREDHVAHLVA